MVFLAHTPAVSADDASPIPPTPEGSETINLPEAFNKIQTEALKILTTNTNACFHNREYHHSGHTQFVMECSGKIFDKEKKLQEKQGATFPLSQEDDREFSVTLGAAHDIDQGKPSTDDDYQGEDEKNSGNWLVNQLTAQGITDPDHIQAALWGLIGTWTKPGKNQIGTRQLFQFVETFNPRLDDLPEGVFPTAQEGTATTVPGINPSALNDPRTLLFSKILADADLAPLGSDWPIYWKNMFSLFREKRQGESFNPTLKDWEKYLQFQVELLQNHHYHTQAANELYPYCLVNAAAVEKILENEAALQASFEAMEKTDDTYHPTNGAMGVIA